MRSIIFFSTAKVAMTEDELAALGRECATNDSQVGISGMLLHKDGSFLQIIEGSNSVIRDMHARILADPRHVNMRTILDRDIEQREFDGPALGFKNLDTAPAGTPFLSPFSYQAFAADPELAMLALGYFFRHS